MPENIDPALRVMTNEWLECLHQLKLFWSEDEAREEAFQRNRSDKWGALVYRVVVGDQVHMGYQQYWVCPDEVAAHLLRMGFSVLPLD